QRLGDDEVVGAAEERLLGRGGVNLVIVDPLRDSAERRQVALDRWDEEPVVARLRPVGQRVARFREVVVTASMLSSLPAWFAPMSQSQNAGQKSMP
ncbi:MAG TPA: hypothetical protein VK324_03205, partial [Tepidisphaeraceae bacterium]|nr:hypothetical protein [Tepidisphaeraceae bacterium]